MDICENCVLQSQGYCWCEGEPEKIISNITKCDYFLNSNSPDYNNAFINGYLWGINRRRYNHGK